MSIKNRKGSGIYNGGNVTFIRMEGEKAIFDQSKYNENPLFREIFEACGIDPQKIADGINSYITETGEKSEWEGNKGRTTEENTRGEPKEDNMIQQEKIRGTTAYRKEEHQENNWRITKKQHKNNRRLIGEEKQKNRRTTRKQQETMRPNSMHCLFCLYLMNHEE